MGFHAEYSNYSSQTKEEMLEQLIMSYEALSSDCDNWVANLSNCASLLWHGYHSLNIPVNWTGFYVTHKPNELILGPFQGKVACQTIEFGKGVCGNAIASEETQLVKDVHKYPGHIACDGETNSEIVVPMIKDGVKIGVLDLDCLSPNGFDEIDKEYLEKLVESILRSCEFPTLH